MMALEKYKAFTLEEKREILSSLFSAYKGLNDYDLDFSAYKITNATTSWGTSDHDFVVNLQECITHRDIGIAKDILYRIIDSLINGTSPSTNKRG